MPLKSAGHSLEPALCTTWEMKRGRGCAGAVVELDLSFARNNGGLVGDHEDHVGHATRDTTHRSKPTDTIAVTVWTKKPAF
jgi:hypothetical protein